MKILLIAPHRLAQLKDSKGTIPVPLLHLAAVLRRGEHNVTIFDFSAIDGGQQPLDEGQIEKTLKSLISDKQPDLIGINCFTSLHFPFTRLLCKVIKSHDSNISIVVGGAHPSLFAQEILGNELSVDFVVLGEGEMQFEALVNALSRSDDESLRRIPALAFRDTNGKIITALPFLETGFARMPGPFMQGDKLDDMAIAADQQMG